MAKWNTSNTSKNEEKSFAVCAPTREPLCVTEIPNKERKMLYAFWCPSAKRATLATSYSVSFFLSLSFCSLCSLCVSFFGSELFFFCFALPRFAIHSMALACISDTVLTTSFLAIQEALNEHTAMMMHHASANALWADVLHKICRDNNVFQFV